MKIGILGTGDVGGTLGTRWAQGGHQVVFSSREPGSQKMKDVVERAGSNARAATVAETAASSDVIALTTPWKATEAALRQAGDLTGKILIDVVNPLLPDLSGLDIPSTTSAGELVAGWAPGAKVVKAFNTVGFPVMANPVIGGTPVVMFYCGDDAAAKQTAAGLAKELGFDARDAGPLRQARLLENFALLWISLAFTQGYGREWGFRVVQ